MAQSAPTSLSPEQRYFADTLFRLRIVQAVGQAYQDLFTRVMELRDSTFRPIKPQGQLGDRKNDGYHSTTGRYYQVYAPENHDPEDLAKTITKIETDFNGLKSYWESLCPIREYYFTLNDRFRGTYPEVESALLRIKSKHALTVCAPFLAKDLMREFGELKDHELMSIAGGHIPSSEFVDDLDFSVFTEVLRHVIEHAPAITPDAILRVPDFDEKVTFNDISTNVESLLRTGSLQSGAVEAYFNANGNYSKRAIRDKLAEIYTQLKSKLATTSDATERADLIYFGLLAEVTPAPFSKMGQDAAIVLLAYFFESCDIYEDPALI